MASANVGEYLSNPINAYLMTKRLTEDWKKVEDTMTYDISNGKILILILTSYTF